MLNIHTLTDETCSRTEYALIIGDEIGNIGTGRPGEVGYMQADPPTYDDAVSGPDAEGRIASMRGERQSLMYHDAFEWFDPHDDAQLLPSRFLHKWKYNQDGVAFGQKSRVVVQGFHEADTRADKAAPVAPQESVHLLVSHAAKHGLLLRQAAISGRHSCAPEFPRRRRLSTSYHRKVSSLLQNKQSRCGDLRRGFMLCAFLLADGTALCMSISWRSGSSPALLARVSTSWMREKC